MSVLALGFPPDCPIPTRVTACGDGIHVARVRWGTESRCACAGLTIDLSDWPKRLRPVQVVLLDQAMDGAEIGDERTVNGRVVNP